MAEQLFQVSMKAVIQNAQGQILMQAEEQADGSVEMWDLPGGRIDQNEHPMAALERELTEEISLGQVLDQEPEFIMNCISNLKFPPEETKGLDVGLLLVAYKLTLPNGFEPVPGEPRSVLRWEQPKRVAELLVIKFPPDFCQYIAEL